MDPYRMDNTRAPLIFESTIFVKGTLTAVEQLQSATEAEALGVHVAFVAKALSYSAGHRKE
jgi:hypothetical protein